MTTVRRREFVRGMLALAAATQSAAAQSLHAPSAAPQQAGPPAAPEPRPAPLAPVAMMRGLDAMQPLPMSLMVPGAAADKAQRFLDEEQMLTLRALCGILQPPLGGQPGALEAGVPEFLDFFLSVSPPETRQLYRSGLDALASETRRSFHVSFPQLTAAQADTLIRPALRGWMAYHPPAEPFARFINLAKDQIRMATVNSPGFKGSDEPSIGSLARPAEGTGLYWFPVDPDLRFEGSAPGHRPPVLAVHAALIPSD